MFNELTKNDIKTQPCSSSVIPMTSGLCRRIREMNLLVLLFLLFI